MTINDELFAEADEKAEELGLSRSRFYQQALERYLRVLRQRDLTERMNRHLQRHGQTVDASFSEYVARVWGEDMGDDEW